MWRYPKELEELEVFKKNTKIIGSIMIVVGFLSAMFPLIATLTTVMFVAWILLFSGFLIGFFTYKHDKNSWRGWLKSIIFICVGSYMIISPVHGVATLGLLFGIYFLMDAFSGFTLVSSYYPNRGWGIWLINAILSMIMAMIFIGGWPHTSILLIGLLVGFSLFFDGLALIMGTKIIDNIVDKHNK
jgi:uncharacterized membrane protein HdeD (DUF308 family)